MKVQKKSQIRQAGTENPEKVIKSKKQKKFPKIGGKDIDEIEVQSLLFLPCRISFILSLPNK